ncbi:hypothetical protein B0H13DRAFT_2430308 [Mycena leptocephala]|nr:hypothetical protein B0H13DRAFT_2430308 [Mycena leptocephala]
MKAITTIICFSSFLSVYGAPLASDADMSASGVMSATTVPSSLSASGGDIPSPSGSTPTAASSAVASILPADKTMGLGANTNSSTLSAYDSSGRPLGQFVANAKVAGSGKNGFLDVTTNTCRPATDDELSKIPGWSKVLAAAGQWATSGQPPIKAYLVFDGYTNPNPAQVCYSTDKIQLSPSGSPQCTSQMDDEKITADNNVQNTTIQRQLTHGVSSTSTTTTTKTSVFSWSTTIEAKAEFGGFEAGVSTTVGLELTNTQGNEHSTTTDDTSMLAYPLTSEPGKTCGLTANITQCTTETTGQVPITLSGNAWFEWQSGFRHPDCTKSLIQPGAPCAGKGAKNNDLNHCYDNNNCAEHSHWNFAVEAYAPDANDRSDPLQFKSGMDTRNTGEYFAYCK